MCNCKDRFGLDMGIYTTMRYFIFLGILLSVAVPVPAAEPCAPTPPYAERIGVTGHQTAQTGTVQVFDAAPNHAYKIPAGFVPVGGTEVQGCVSFPSGQSAVFVKDQAFVVSPLAVDAPFEVKLVTPKAVNAEDIAIFKRKLAHAYAGVATLYPLGFGANHTQPFYIFATHGLVGTGDKAADLLTPLTGTGLGVLPLPANHPRLGRDAALLMAHLFTARPHPDAGPYLRKHTQPPPQDIPVMPLADYDALVAGYAVMAVAETEEERLLHLYDLIHDYAGYIDGADWTGPLDPILRPYGNPLFTATWTGLTGATEVDARFYKTVAAPIEAARLANLLNTQNRSLAEIFKAVHGGKADFVLPALGVNIYPQWFVTQRLDDRKQVIYPQRETHDFGRDIYQAAANMGWITLPQPLNEERIASHSGFMDAKHYRQSRDGLADKVFLLTSFADPLNASFDSQPADVMHAKLIDSLLDHGDVLFVNRFRQGKSVGLMDEFYNNCAAEDLRWAVKKGGLHMADAVRWLHLRGYKNVYGVGISRGATVLIAAAEDVPFEGLFLMNPWRGKDVEGLSPEEQLKPQCGGGNFMQVMEGFVKGTKAKSLHAVSHNDLLTYLAHNKWEKRYLSLFTSHTSYMPPPWVHQWLYDSTYPNRWMALITQKLNP